MAGGRPWHQHSEARRLQGARVGIIFVFPPASCVLLSARAQLPYLLPVKGSHVFCFICSVNSPGRFEKSSSTVKLKVGKCLTHWCSVGTSKTVFKNWRNESPCLLQLHIFKQENESVLFQPSWFLYRNLANVWELLGELCCPLCASCMHMGEIHGKPCWIL